MVIVQLVVVVVFCLVFVGVEHGVEVVLSVLWVCWCEIWEL